MLLHFGTLFNITYLNRGLALLQSLRTNLKSFHLFILCLDWETFEYFQKEGQKDVTIINLSEVEGYFPELSEAKGNRNLVEYYFTLSPVLPLYIFDNFSNVDHITTLDADIYFYSDPTPIFTEMGDNSVLITPHRFPPPLKSREIFGLYNVSFQSFKRDEIGLKCLHKWKSECVDWCYDRLEDGKFADQKYLDTWEREFGKVKVLEHKGAGLAPWNVMNYDLTLENNKLRVDDQPLIFYHFHGLKFLKRKLILHSFEDYKSFPSRVVIRNLYIPYIQVLIMNTAKLEIKSVISRISYSYYCLIKRFLTGGMLYLKNNGSIIHINSMVHYSYLWIKRIILGKHT